MSIDDIIDNHPEKPVDHVEQNLNLTGSKRCVAPPRLASEIALLLDAFSGEDSLKRLFWELLSYDRVREPLPLTLLPPSAIAFMGSLELFAESAALAVAIARVRFIPDDGRIELAVWAIKRSVGECIVLVADATSWTLIYPDETLKPRVRAVSLPGPQSQRRETVEALAALNSAREDSGEEFSAFDLAENIDAVFPGPTPNIGAVLTEFEWMEQHPNPEMRDLLPFIRIAGRYPLLTAAQECGEDLAGSEVPPEETSLTFQEWRLVMHNLRLIVWLASKTPAVGLTLSDLVQEGCVGLITAAKRFDPSREIRFSTYAYYWIRQAMFRALQNQCNVIRWPVYRSVVLLPAVLQGRDEGRTPGERPLQPLEYRIQRRLWRLSNRHVNPLDHVVGREVRAGVRQALSTLKLQQEEVIQRRYGIGSGTEETLESIGRSFGKTRERIRQIESKAVEKLVKYHTEELSPYFAAAEWRRSCPVGDASALPPAPFTELLSEPDVDR